VSPLWNDKALAEAAWANAVARGLVDDDGSAGQKKISLDRVRRVLRPPMQSYAL